MSTQKGNSHRSRPQKHQNHFAFKNNLHDTSHKTKIINNLQIANVCDRCKQIIEWKIKYKKYKPLKAPGKCNKCDLKTVKHAYHTMCGPCAKEKKVCPKCGKQAEVVEAQPSKEEQLKLDAEMQNMLKTLSERRRRTFIRFMNKQTGKGDKGKRKRKEKNKDVDSKSEISDTTSDDGQPMEITRDDIINKLKSLMIAEDDDDDFDLSDFEDDDDADDADESDCSEQ